MKPRPVSRCYTRLKISRVVTFWPNRILCAVAWLREKSSLLVSHRGVHSGDDGLTDAALLQLHDLGGSEIEINRRLFDALDYSPFGKPGINETNHALVCERRCLLKLRRCTRAGFRWRLDDSHRRRPTDVPFILISTKPAPGTTR